MTNGFYWRIKMNYNLKDVFNVYFTKAKKVGLKYKIKYLFKKVKGHSFYGATPKIGDKMVFVMHYDRSILDINHLIGSSAKVLMLYEREVDRFCEDYELMSIYEKEKTIEEEIKSPIIRVVKKEI